jgi:hypothetical protein
MLRRETVCWPLGLHWIGREFYRFWTWTYSWNKTRWEKKCEEIEAKVYKRREQENVQEVTADDYYPASITIPADVMKKVMQVLSSREQEGEEEL